MQRNPGRADIITILKQNASEASGWGNGWDILVYSEEVVIL
jgi:hypothetical protein